jgi:hypothetical protein
MINIKVSYGCESVNKTYSEAPTIGQLKSDTNIKGVLGCGDNIKATMNGIEMPDNSRVEGGTQVAEVKFETVANKKA